MRKGRHDEGILDVKSVKSASDGHSRTRSEHVRLFYDGKNANTHEFLGAHFTKDGVVFRVWAPNARRVFLSADFNFWNGERHELKRTADGIWEIFCAEAHEYTMYKYIIETKDGKRVEKCDPYAFHTETRPGNASRVYNMKGYEWNDASWIISRKERQSVNSPINIYEMHLGSWRRGENGEFYTYERIADELIPYIKDMGYTHVEFLPVMEHPLDMSWGYQCLGYFAPTSRYGEPRDFMKLIDRLHQAEIGVILDWVPAHFPKDACGLAMFDGTPLYEGWDEVQREHPSWGTLIFDYKRNEVRSFLLSSAFLWLDYYHADGFRIDAVASMLYLDFCRGEKDWHPNEYGGNENIGAIEFIRELNTTILENFPDVLLIAEESTSWPMVTRPVYTGGLGFSYKWNMGWMNDILEYVKLDPVYRKYKHNNLTFSMTYAFSEKFVLPLSHDEVVHMKNSLIGRMPGEYELKFSGLRALYGYMYTHPGKKLLFMGGELGQFNEWHYESQLDWSVLDYEMHRKLKSYVKALNELYLTSPELYELDGSWDGFRWISCENFEENIIVFIRRSSDGGELVAAINFAPVPREGYVVGLDRDAAYREVLNSDEQRYGGSDFVNDEPIIPEEKEWNGFKYSASIKIPPMGIVILRPEEENA